MSGKIDVYEMPPRSVNYRRPGTSEVRSPMQIDPITCACGCGEMFVPTRRSRPQRFIGKHATRLLRKESPKVLSKPRRLALYAAAGDACQKCGLTMAEQIERFGRRLEIHHVNHDHEDNTAGNHEVLCTGCHNHESLVVRDEAKKVATLRARLATGEVKIWSQGHTKETHPSLAQMAAKKKGRVPWNKKR